MQTSHKYSPKQKRTLRTTNASGYRTTQEQGNPVKVVCIIGGESKALGFHQIQAKTHQEKRKNQRKTRKARNGFCIKLYIDFLCKKSQTCHAIHEILIISIKIYRYIFQIQNFIYILLHKLKPQKTAVTLKQTVTRK